MEDAPMYKLMGWGALFCLALAGSSRADDKGTVVDLDGLTSKTPAAWKKAKPLSNLRFMQFKLPAVKDDKVDADVVLYKNLGGSVRDNLARWKKQFQPPRGKTIEDVARVREIKIAGLTATCLDIHGTFRPPSFDPKYKGKPQPNFRMLAVQFKGPENLYHIKLTGPARSVEHYKKGFDTWLTGFKK
jgi:hypothetical protein